MSDDAIIQLATIIAGVIVAIFGTRCFMQWRNDRKS